MARAAGEESILRLAYQIAVEHLDRDQPLELEVEGLPDSREAAAPELFEELVAAREAYATLDLIRRADRPPARALIRRGWLCAERNLTLKRVELILQGAQRAGAARWPKEELWQ